jgi:hypothetical protein
MMRPIYLYTANIIRVIIQSKRPVHETKEKKDGQISVSYPIHLSNLFLPFFSFSEKIQLLIKCGTRKKAECCRPQFLLIESARRRGKFHGIFPNFKSNVDGDISHNMKGDGRGDNGSTKIKGASPKTGVLFI